MTNKPLWPVQFDLETTGININTANVCQVAAVHGGPHEAMGNMRPVTLMSNYVNPGCPIPAGATEVHGITDAMVANAPPQEEAIQGFANLLEEISETHEVVLSGHNIERYDIPIIKRILPGAFDRYPTIDTYTFAMRNFGAKEQKLGLLFSWYILDSMDPVVGKTLIKDAHDAAADCHMCAYLLAQMLTYSGLTVLEFYESQLEGVVLEIFPFGKYRGLKLSDVPKGYLSWCRANFTEPHKDIETTICHYLGCDSY